VSTISTFMLAETGGLKPSLTCRVRVWIPIEQVVDDVGRATPQGSPPRDGLDCSIEKGVYSSAHLYESRSPSMSETHPPSDTGVLIW